PIVEPWRATVRCWPKEHANGREKRKEACAKAGSQARQIRTKPSGQAGAEPTATRLRRRACAKPESCVMPAGLLGTRDSREFAMTDWFDLMGAFDLDAARSNSLDVYQAARLALLKMRAEQNSNTQTPRCATSSMHSKTRWRGCAAGSEPNRASPISNW